MRNSILAAGWLAISIVAVRASGHGNPIQVNVADGQLTVANGLTLTDGYVRLASDPHEDAALDFGPNQTLRSVYPGYDLAGLAPDAALQFEIIGRPDFNAVGQPTRWLWFWDPTLHKVATAANDPTFDVLPLFRIGQHPGATVDDRAWPNAYDGGSHRAVFGTDQHLLIYQLQNSPAARIGVYGVFARLASPGLAPSEPFLLAFRYGVVADDFAIAAEAINIAAALHGRFQPQRRRRRCRLHGLAQRAWFSIHAGWLHHLEE